MKAPAGIVQSVFDFAIRELNALDVRAAQCEDDADDTRWEEARHMVALLDAGLPQRELARQWINARTGKPYDEKQVRIVRKVWKVGAELTPRPLYRDLYQEIANPGVSGKVNRLLHQTGDYEWYSPPEIVSAAREVLGVIDLDPASCDVANTVVKASQIYTAETNGLEQPWHGRVFLNPPYRQPDINQWCEKFAQHAKAGDIQGIVLVNNGTDTEWFDKLAAVADAFCFPSFRCRYWQPDRETSTALQGQVIVYTGSDRKGFCRRFAELGLVVVPAGSTERETP